jgi:hypothetical protein
MEKNAILFILTFSFTLIAGCLMVPVPTAEHGSYSDTGSPDRIEEDEIEHFRPGITKREDVLFICGDPSLRLEEDRYFVYCWEGIQGYLVGVIFPFTVMLPVPAAMPYMKTNLLCLEFTDDNKLKRIDRLYSTEIFPSCPYFITGERPEILQNWLQLE